MFSRANRNAKPILPSFGKQSETRLEVQTTRPSSKNRRTINVQKSRPIQWQETVMDSQDILKIRLALDRATKSSDASYLEVLELRTQLQHTCHDLTVSRQRESELGHQLEAYRTAATRSERNYTTLQETSTSQLNQLQDAQEKITQMNNMQKDHTKIKTAFKEKIHLLRQFALQLETNLFNAPNFTTLQKAGMDLVARMQVELKCITNENPASHGQERSSSERLKSAPSLERVIPQYRMAIVKTRARVKFLESQLQHEQRGSDELRRQISYCKSKILDANGCLCECTKPSSFESESTTLHQVESVELSHLHMMCAAQDKSNKQLRTKMVAQGRMIEKMQQVIQKQHVSMPMFSFSEQENEVTNSNEMMHEKQDSFPIVQQNVDVFPMPLDVTDLYDESKDEASDQDNGDIKF